MSNGFASQDLSHSDFGDVEAQLWAAARVGPLPLQCLGFRRANRWRVESHRAFAEQLAPCAAQAVPLSALAVEVPDVFRAEVVAPEPPRRSALLRLALRRQRNQGAGFGALGEP
eukprot:Skav215697  [mRNA]  locus=scaffold3538:81030:86554:+ [translate_table: standard]